MFKVFSLKTRLAGRQRLYRKNKRLAAVRSGHGQGTPAARRDISAAKNLKRLNPRGAFKMFFLKNVSRGSAAIVSEKQKTRDCPARSRAGWLCGKARYRRGKDLKRLNPRGTFKMFFLKTRLAGQRRLYRKNERLATVRPGHGQSGKESFEKRISTICLSSSKNILIGFCDSIRRYGFC